MLDQFPKEHFAKAVKWNAFTFVFGFLTLIIMLIINLFVYNYSFKEELIKQINDLVFLYFAVGITMSITLDYYFLKSRRKIKVNSWIYFFAAVILFFGVVIFTLSSLNGAGKLADFKNNNYIQYFTLIICMVYSLLVKTFMFTIEK